MYALNYQALDNQAQVSWCPVNDSRSRGETPRLWRGGKAPEAFVYVVKYTVLILGLV